MEKGPVTGWALDAPDLPARSFKTGTSLHALGAFRYRLTNLDMMHEWYDEAALTAQGLPLDLVQALGIPHNAQYFQITVEAPLQWTDYRLILDATRLAPSAPAGTPIFYDYFFRSEPVHLLAWRRRVIYVPTAEWVEIQWRPDQGERFLVHQETATRSLAEATTAHKALHKGWQLLYRVGQTRADSATVRAVLTQAVQQLQRDNRRTSQENVAEQLSRTPRHVQRLFREHIKLVTGETWKAFVTNVREGQKK